MKQPHQSAVVLLYLLKGCVGFEPQGPVMASTAGEAQLLNQEPCGVLHLRGSRSTLPSRLRQHRRTAMGESQQAPHARRQRRGRHESPLIRQRVPIECERQIHDIGSGHGEEFMIKRLRMVDLGLQAQG
ncbi:hypothetical protein [uncultured Thiodictyon sp.]|uniref:hypothetical protein n=1 Tax=uncultured Thiodictyon sp. TaxID=1846217 RepID=UPI0025D17CC4|nr:hypothetical protein [uncultured Thiodictyon sp.]